MVLRPNGVCSVNKRQLRAIMASCELLLLVDHMVIDTEKLAVGLGWRLLGNVVTYSLLIDIKFSSCLWAKLPIWRHCHI